jgi:HD superfamily phosphohydrolase
MIVRTLIAKKPYTYRDPLDKLLLRSVRLLALFHDVGHGPFSHASERVYLEFAGPDEKKEMRGKFRELSPHDYITMKLLQEYMPAYVETVRDDFVKGTGKEKGELEDEFNRLLKFLEINCGSFVGPLIQPLFYASPDKKKPEILHCYVAFKQILDSYFDVDKLDYIQRDGYVSGVKLGHLDVGGLVTNLGFDEDHEDLVFARQAVSALETLVVERYKLYRWLNLHHNVCFTDELVTRIMELCMYHDEACHNSSDKLFGQDGIGLSYFRSLCEQDLRKPTKSHSVDLIDDDYVLTKSRALKKSRTDVDESSRTRLFLNLLDEGEFWDPIWDVGTYLAPEEEELISRLRSYLHKHDTNKGTIPEAGKTRELEKRLEHELDNSGKTRVLIAYKPFEPIQMGLDIKVLDESGSVTSIKQASGLVAALWQRAVKAPYKTRDGLIEGMAGFKEYRAKNALAFRKAVKELASDVLRDTPQLSVPLYVYVEGGAKIANCRKRTVGILKDAI